MIDKLKKIWEKSAFNESSELLIKKMEDHRRFAGNVLFYGAFLGTLLWIWDYVIDPSGASQTLFYRLGFLILLPAFFYIRTVKDPYKAGYVSLFFLMITIVIYMKILTLLDQGMLYGIGGFMFYMLLPPIVFQAYPLLVNIFSIILIAAFPQLLAAIGFVEGFQQANYAVLIWSAAVIVMIIQYFYARDYHKRFHLEKLLESLSYTDILSGLHNRRYFMESFQKALESKQGTGDGIILMIIDIDRFKRINDTHGHPSGDQVIQTFSKLFCSEAKAPAVVARIGGEEFGILLPHTDTEKAKTVAERIRSRSEAMVFQSPLNEIFSTTLSIGLVVSSSGDNTTSLLKKADEALYEAKKAGRNRIEFYREVKDTGQ